MHIVFNHESIWLNDLLMNYSKLDIIVHNPEFLTIIVNLYLFLPEYFVSFAEEILGY